MAEIKGFKGILYNTEKASKIESLVCPPYDIISKDEREQLIKNNKYNMVNLELPVAENKYEKAGQDFKAWCESGILQKDEKDSIYIYEEEFMAYGKKHKIKGFISLVRIEEFAKNIVLPHEETLSKAKDDRFNLMSTTNANFSQIYSLYIDDKKEISSKIAELSNGVADIEFTLADGVTHRFYKISDEKAIADIAAKFENRKLFIADGHHRYETALNYRNKLIENGTITDKNHLGNFVMMMLVDMENDGLVVFPTHRILSGLENFSESEKLEKISEFFKVEKINSIDNIENELLEDQTKTVFAFYTGKDYYFRLTKKENVELKDFITDKSNAYCDLDVTALHTLILEKIFGIDKANMANGKNLTYTRDISEAISKVQSGNSDCSFIINATKVTQIKDVALAKEKMPQKSTYFYPKIITGLVINKFID
ncbi:MAG: DUF1015 domain-containing protein [Clostridia bacterium]